MSFISKDHFNMALKGVKRLIDQVSKNIVQPDWNETDETSKAYIQNKPFEEKGTEYIFVDLENAPISGQGAAILSSACEYELIPGNIYKVIINGVEKEIECTKLSAYPGSKFLMLDPDSRWNHRVIFQQMDTSYIKSFTPYEWGTTPTSVKVIGKTQPMKKLSEKYIPTTIARLSDVDGTMGRIFYGTCSTSSSTPTKEVSVNGSSFILRQGATVCIYFTNTNTSSSATLNVNKTGAKTISLSNSTSLTSSYWAPNSYVTFLYDGVYWRIISMSPGSASTSYYGITKLSSSVSSTSTSTAATSSAVKSAYDLANKALPKTGGALTGALTLQGDPTSNLHAATKQYVDNAVKNVNIPEQVQADWNQNDETAKDYVKNRTHYEKKEEFEYSIHIGNSPIVSDSVWNELYEQRLTAKYINYAGGQEYFYDGDEDGTTHFYIRDTENNHRYLVYRDSSMVAGTQKVDTTAIMQVNLIVFYSVQKTEVHKLDEKFIPDSIARIDDIPDAVPTPTTAKAGQTIMVESVDENGKPTSWKPVDVVIKNLDDITTMKETNLQCGFYYRLSDPLPDGWYYYDDAKYGGKVPTLVVINKENTAVAGVMPLNAALLMYITSSETYITVRIHAVNGGVSIYGYNLETNKADYYREGAYSAARADYFLNQKISSPEVAEVNQLLSVKTVDENGKPTEWEAIDRTHYDDGETIKQLDEKFIPDTIARKTDIPTDEYITNLINNALQTYLGEGK